MSRKASRPVSITITVASPAWRKHAGLVPVLRRAARRALRPGALPGTVSVLLTDDAELHVLNLQFRGHDKPTNVLSFPSRQAGHLGDIAIAYGVTARDAKVSGKRFADHAVHLVVHGTLHLLGYDHETAREALEMEALETRILAAMNIADPYAAEKVA